MRRIKEKKVEILGNMFMQYIFAYLWSIFQQSSQRTDINFLSRDIYQMMGKKWSKIHTR